MKGPPAPPPRHATLARALLAAEGHPSGVTFVDLREREERLSWGEVRRRALLAAGALAGLGIRPGDRVAIVLRTEPAFLDAFLGSMLAGAVPVPLYPPVRLGRMEEYLATTARMIAVSGARIAVAGGATRRLLGEAVERARSGGGPTLVEAVTYRFWGHLMGDAMEYMPKEERKAAMEADPVPRYRQWLIDNGHATADDLTAIESKAQDAIEDAVQFALDSPFPDPSELYTDVYAEVVR